MDLLKFEPLLPGRNVDVLAFQTSEPFATRTTIQKVFEGNGGKACVGLQKLAQQVVLRLYTERGKKLYSNNDGTSFVTSIRTGHIRTSADAARAFAMAKDNLIGLFFDDQFRYPTMPLDEQLADLELLAINISGDVLSLTMQITSRAGVQDKFIFPITVN